MTRNLRIGALLVATGMVASAPVVAGEKWTTKELRQSVVSVTCNGCHGVDGASAGHAPVIGGLPESYLNDTMMNYKNGTRHSTIMGRIAKGYDEVELADMSAYFAKMPWVSGEQTIDADMVKKGKELHNAKGCMGCHGSDGNSANPNTPRLAGQYVDFLVFQMQDYRDEGVAIPPSAMIMRSMLGSASDEDLTALAHFYASHK